MLSVDISSIDDGRFDELHTPSYIGKTRVGGIDLNKHRIRVVTEAIISFSPKPGGITATDLTHAVRQRDPVSFGDYTPREASYDPKKYRSIKWKFQKI